MHDFISLLGTIAWPTVVVLSLLFFLGPIRALITEMARNADRLTKIKINHAGIELAMEVIKGTIVEKNSDNAATSEEKTRAFEALVAKYGDLSISNRAERVIERRQLADRMGQLTMELKLSRSALSEARAEGKIVALATAIIQKSSPSDLVALEKAAKTAVFKFTRYRIVLALCTILASPTPKASILKRIEKVLDDVENVPQNPADESLQVLIDKTRTTIVSLYDTLA